MSFKFRYLIFGELFICLILFIKCSGKPEQPQPPSEDGRLCTLAFQALLHPETGACAYVGEGCAAGDLQTKGYVLVRYEDLCKRGCEDKYLDCEGLRVKKTDCSTINLSVGCREILSTEGKTDVSTIEPLECAPLFHNQSYFAALRAGGSDTGKCALKK